jgi:hypothetical protein
MPDKKAAAAAGKAEKGRKGTSESESSSDSGDERPSGCTGDLEDALAVEWGAQSGNAKGSMTPLLVSDKYVATKIPRLREFQPETMKLNI